MKRIHILYLYNQHQPKKRIDSEKDINKNKYIFTLTVRERIVPKDGDHRLQEGSWPSGLIRALLEPGIRREQG